MEHVARKLGVQLEEPKADPEDLKRWTDIYLRIGFPMKPKSLAEELEGFPWFVVLEQDRLRIIAHDQAPAFWSSWWESVKTKDR